MKSLPQKISSSKSSIIRIPFYRALAPLSVTVLAVVVGVIGIGKGMHALGNRGQARLTSAPNSPATAPKEVPHHRVSEWSGERSFHGAPNLDSAVASGNLPRTDDRLPQRPLVVIPPEQKGPYGGNWNQFATSAGDIGAMLNSYEEGLVRWDPSMSKILANLATHWDIHDEGKTYVFHLRKGLRWSDGVPFTSADILFWYNKVILNKELTPSPPPYLRRAGKLMEVSAPNAETVVFKFSEPHGLFLRWVARMGYEMTRYPAHYFGQFHPDTTPAEELSERVRSAGFPFWYQYFEDRVNWRNPDRPTLSPWVIENPPPARRITFQRNPYYWKVDDAGNQLPYIDSLSFVITAAESINLQFISGEMGMQYRNARLKNFPLLSSHAKSGGYRIKKWVSSVGSGVLMLNLNHKDPQVKGLFGDLRFRRALSLAINRHEINEAVYLGMGTPTQMAAVETSPLYDAELALHATQFDSAEANRLLDEMGLTMRDSDGFRLAPDGVPLRLTIEMFDLLGDMEALQLVSQYWSDIGIKTDVKQMARALFYARMPARLHSVTLGGNTSMLDPLLDYATFIPRSTGARHALGYSAWFLSAGARGEEPPAAMRKVGDLYRQIEETTDEEKQAALAREILLINTENLWVIGLLGKLPSLTVVNNHFRNVPDKAVVLGTQNLTAPECYAIDR